MVPVKLPPTYFEQSTTAEVRQYKPPLESAELDDPVKAIYHLTGRQLIPSIGTAPYKPEGMEWYRNDDNPILYRRQNLTYLFESLKMPLPYAVLTSSPKTNQS